jgi:hypothetical protein
MSGPFEVTFHVELTHSPDKRVSRGVAKKIITFLPHPGMNLGERELLTVEQVHWLGFNNFQIHLQPIRQPVRADPKYVEFADLQAMKDDASAAFKHLDWQWTDEATG